MSGLNLHHIVRSLITAVHPDEVCQLLQADGHVNNKGVITPTYRTPQTIKANIQPLDKKTLSHLEQVEDTKSTMQAFLYADADFPVNGVSRMPTLRSGDFMQRADGTWWLINTVIQDWSRDGWANVGICQQVTPPEGVTSDDTR